MPLKSVTGHARYVSHRLGLWMLLVCLASALLWLSGCGGSVTVGSDAGIFLVTPSTAAFGNVTVGQSSTVQLSLINRTLSTVQVSSINVSGSGFSLATSVSLPVSIQAGGTYQLTVQFAPLVAGSSTGQLSITTTAAPGTPTVVDLSGTGVQSTPSIALSSLSCTTTAFTGAGTGSCTVTLTGATSAAFSVQLASNNAAVTLPSAVTVPAGSPSATFSVTVAAVSSVQTATLTATAGSVTSTVTLQLQAISALLGVNATAIDFGDVVLNSPSSQTVTLTSTGTAAVTVNSATLTGTGFALTSGTFPATLAPGSSAALTVQFDPLVSGAATGQLTIVSTSTTNPTVNIPLSGTGVTQAVSLTWDAPTLGTTAGYNVYRATNGSSSFQLISGSLVTPTSYLDSAIASGTTYQYYVTAIDSTGAESTPSNTATVAVP